MGGGLGGWRNDATQAEVHGLRGVVVGPRTRKHQKQSRAGHGVIPEDDYRVAEV
jgi:hypothetical protein